MSIFERNVAMGVTLSFSQIIENKRTESPGTTVPTIKLGKTGESVSRIALGGVVLMNETQTDANNAVALAFDRGVTYYDVAPSYGNAEERLGPALAPYRSQSFLACKTTERTKAGAEKNLNASLQHLQTDHFDLYQLHALSSIEEVETALGPNGAMEVILKAQQEGKVRFIGFSAHSQEAALLALEKFDFDTTLFPVNYVCWHQGRFGPPVLDIAKERGMGVIALKSLGQTLIHEGEDKPYEKCWYRPIPYEEDILVEQALRFTLSRVHVIVPPGEPAYFWKALDMIDRIAPLTVEEESAVKNLSSGIEPIFKSGM